MTEQVVADNLSEAIKAAAEVKGHGVWVCKGIYPIDTITKLDGSITYLWNVTLDAN